MFQSKGRASVHTGQLPRTCRDGGPKDTVNMTKKKTCTFLCRTHATNLKMCSTVCHFSLEARTEQQRTSIGPSLAKKVAVCLRKLGRLWDSLPCQKSRSVFFSEKKELRAIMVVAKGFSFGLCFNQKRSQLVRWFMTRFLWEKPNGASLKRLQTESCLQNTVQQILDEGQVSEDKREESVFAKKNIDYKVLLSRVQ